MLSNHSILLRPFAEEDASIILNWCKNKREFRLWSADRYKGFLAKPEDMMVQYAGGELFPLTMLEDGIITGHILLRYPSEDKTTIRFGFIIVDNTLRGQGYGKQLLQLAIDYAVNKLGAQKITLGVFCDNYSAVECYKSVGFQIIDEESYSIDGEIWKGYEMQYSCSQSAPNRNKR